VRNFIIPTFISLGFYFKCDLSPDKLNNEQKTAAFGVVVMSTAETGSSERQIKSKAVKPQSQSQVTSSRQPET